MKPKISKKKVNKSLYNFLGILFLLLGMFLFNNSFGNLINNIFTKDSNFFKLVLSLIFFYIAYRVFNKRVRGFN